jgi:hypothetical protein
MLKVLGNLVGILRLLAIKYGRRLLKKFEPQINTLKSKATAFAEKYLPQKKKTPPAAD